MRWGSKVGEQPEFHPLLAGRSFDRMCGSGDPDLGRALHYLPKSRS